MIFHRRLSLNVVEKQLKRDKWCRLMKRKFYRVIHFRFMHSNKLNFDPRRGGRIVRILFRIRQHSLRCEYRRIFALDTVMSWQDLFGSLKANCTKQVEWYNMLDRQYARVRPLSPASGFTARSSQGLGAPVLNQPQVWVLIMRVETYQ